MSGDSERALRMAVPLALALIALVALVIASGMGNPVNQPIGPGLVPMVLCVVIIAGSLGDLLAVWRAAGTPPRMVTNAGPGAGGREAGTPADTPGPLRQSAFAAERKWIICGLALLAGVFIWKYVGYVPGLGACILSVVLFDGEMKPIHGVAFSAIVVLALWALFDMVLRVPLG